ncbi:skin secretory protein xP2-like isoform X2 [Gopherus flavomarginatus]|uniref:skin secretory protein xP2-like isoform X2 n=1 Tax=Gopherus flavomarginatus TaxID=286002 RepID=UPI0021CBD386|nr:skin secretory protein xP2-like isoform X2 [Gopherus flavomarginatus]
MYRSLHRLHGPGQASGGSPHPGYPEPPQSPGPAMWSHQAMGWIQTPRAFAMWAGGSQDAVGAVTQRFATQDAPLPEGLSRVPTGDSGWSPGADPVLSTTGERLGQADRHTQQEPGPALAAEGTRAQGAPIREGTIHRLRFQPHPAPAPGGKGVPRPLPTLDPPPCGHGAPGAAQTVAAVPGPAPQAMIDLGRQSP